jgi:VCBS repeat-containing protein
VHNNTNRTFSLALADLDGDGYVDLVEGNTFIPTQIYLNQGAGNPGFFSAPVALADSNPLHQALGLVLRDFDRDGDIDILEANNGAWDDDGDAGAGESCLNPGASTPCVGQPVRLYLNNGNGTFANGINFAPSEIQKIYGIDAGDVDQDGRLDFVTAHSSLNEGGPPALSTNAVYMNGGTPGAGNVRQLDSIAISASQVGSGVAIPHARLSVTRAQSAPQAQMTWYLSNDAGATFLRTTPGVPVAFPNPNGSQLMWKVEMLQASPSAAQNAQVSEISITDNTRPTFIDQGDLAGVEGQNFLSTLALYFSDGDADSLTYQISGLPAGTGLSLDGKTGVLSGVPTNSDAVASPISLTISAFDGAESRSGNIALTVTNAVNDPPTANDDGPYTIDEGGTIAGTFNVLDNDVDPDGAPMNAVLDNPPTNFADFELRPDGTFDYTHNGGETTADSFTYRADDGGSQSNIATVSITITPVNDAPTINLVGNATIDIKEGDAFVDPGAVASDEEDGDISADIVVGGDAVDTGTPGAYVITYDVSDSGGLAAVQVTRSVNVNEDMPPVVTLVGNASITLTVGDAYAEQGATASDPEDGDISASIVVGGDVVNTAAAGTYVVTYNVTDSFGNAATEVTRTVTVNNPPEPPPPPKKKKGGGAAGLLEVAGLMMFTGLVLFRRRRARKPLV